jgi:selT/selW/selH-like putative selenoprotein
LGIEVELQAGSGGVFAIMADDQLVFSKKQAGRHPAPGEVIDKLRQLLA